ncbi:MAG TPA: hypothetical protein VLC55_04835, partial [Burkholderiales bacterium]|nr:hypothetical protein [Burkholderiales bacterium]
MSAIPRPAEHPVKLSGLRASSLTTDAPPLVIKRMDQDFVDGLLADLADDGKREALAAAAPAGTLRLLHPVQRVFHLAVFEAFCDFPGQPRVDRAKIEGAGMVVRRVEQNRRLAWVKAGTRHFGWEAVEQDVDPALDKRKLPVSVGNAFINARLPSNLRHRNAGAARIKPEAEVTEQVYPLFVAPPEVCAAAGKTLLFAVVPASASEQAEAPGPEAADAGSFPSSPGYGTEPAERSALRAHLVHYLKQGAAKPLPLAASNLQPDWIKSAAAEQKDDETAAVFGRLGTFLLLLQQLHVEFNAFASEPAAQRLRQQLNRLRVERDRVVSGHIQTTTEPAGDFLEKAKDILLDGKPGSLTMPHRWSAVGQQLAEDLFQATLACLDAQYRKIRPAQGRFDDADARYQLRAFIRVKCEQPGCPPRLVWSQYSAPYAIAPWHESGGAPPQTVSLPNLFDRQVLAALKPNVAFTLPAGLAKLLRSDAKKLRDGEDTSGGGLDIEWI